MEAIIIYIVVIAVIAALIVYEYFRAKKPVNMSFRESMDLVDLPVITFYNNGNKYNFLLDTGATMSVIDSNVISNMQYEELANRGTLFGMEGKKIEVPYIRASLEYKDRKYEEDFQVTDMSEAFKLVKAESGVQLSGILGSLFFKKYQYILDFESLIAYSKRYI